MKTLLAHGTETHDAVTGAVTGHHYATHEWVGLGLTIAAFVFMMGYLIRKELIKSKAAPAKPKRASAKTKRSR